MVKPKTCNQGNICKTTIHKPLTTCPNAPRPSVQKLNRAVLSKLSELSAEDAALCNAFDWEPGICNNPAVGGLCATHSKMAPRSLLLYDAEAAKEKLEENWDSILFDGNPDSSSVKWEEGWSQKGKRKLMAEYLPGITVQRKGKFYEESDGVHWVRQWSAKVVEVDEEKWVDHVMNEIASEHRIANPPGLRETLLEEISKFGLSDWEKTTWQESDHPSAGHGFVDSIMPEYWANNLEYSDIERYM